MYMHEELERPQASPTSIIMRQTTYVTVVMQCKSPLWWGHCFSLGHKHVCWFQMQTIITYVMSSLFSENQHLCWYKKWRWYIIQFCRNVLDCLAVKICLYISRGCQCVFTTEWDIFCSSAATALLTAPLIGVWVCTRVA